MDPGQTDLFSLDARTALVAGASRGIGAAIARGLARAGAEVYACGRSPQPLEPNSAVSYAVCDVTDHDGFEGLCRQIALHHQAIDGFVFAAGITTPTEEAQSFDAFARTIAINLTAAYQTAMTAAQWMPSGSSIVFITSINSTLGFPGNPGYVAAKGGLRQLTKALAVDFGPRGIRVNAIAPGYIRTEMTRSSYNDREAQNARTGRTILGRWGEPDDLIGAAIFLLSRASAYMTGQDVFIDGGWTAKGL